MTKCRVELTQGEREELLARVNRGSGRAAEIKRANLLLAVDQGGFADLRMTDKEAAMACRSTVRTVHDLKGNTGRGGVRRRARAQGAQGAGKRQDRRRGRGEDRRPDLHGSARGSRQAGASARRREERGARLRRVHVARRRRQHAKKNELRPWPREEWCVPEHSGELVAAMEDVLRACERPRDPRHPLVCLDESSRQLVAHAREALPARPGSAERWDYEYVRNGVADMLVAFAPLECERHARLTRTRTRVDLAETLRWVSDDLFPGAEGIVLVWDDPDTHSMGSPCEAFRRGRPSGWPPASRPITRPSTGAGWTWRRSGSVAPCGTAFRRALGASTRWDASRPPGRRTATHAPARSSGASPSTTPARGSPICIRRSNSKKRKNRY